MIRKAVIAMLTLASGAVMVLAWYSTVHGDVWCLRKTPPNVACLGVSGASIAVYWFWAENEKVWEEEASFWQRHIESNVPFGWASNGFFFETFSGLSPSASGRLKSTIVAVPLVLPFVLLAAYPTIAFIRGPLRRWRRKRKGLCPKCAYDLRGSTDRCPECGTAIPNCSPGESKP